MNQYTPCIHLMIIITCIVLYELVHPRILPGSDWSTPPEPPGKAWDCNRSVNLQPLFLYTQR
jgi:hypothetical protein